MVTELCGDDPALWKEASQAAEGAIRTRLELWNGILEEIQGLKAALTFCLGPTRVCDRKSAWTKRKLQAVCRLLLLPSAIIFYSQKSQYKRFFIPCCVINPLYAQRNTGSGPGGLPRCQY